MIDIDAEPTSENRGMEEDSLLSRHRFLKLGLLGGRSCCWEPHVAGAPKRKMEATMNRRTATASSKKTAGTTTNRKTMGTAETTTMMTKIISPGG